jgi:hypothetical protein
MPISRLNRPWKFVSAFWRTLPCQGRPIFNTLASMLDMPRLCLSFFFRRRTCERARSLFRSDLCRFWSSDRIPLACERPPTSRVEMTLPSTGFIDYEQNVAMSQCVGRWAFPPGRARLGSSLPVCPRLDKARRNCLTVRLSLSCCVKHPAGRASSIPRGFPCR